MQKGDPVLVRGRFKAGTYEDKDGRPRTETRITADTVGHDLSRGIATYIRQRAQRPPEEGSPEEGSLAGGSPVGEQDLQTPGLGVGPGEMLDEEAIERFGRDLDEPDLPSPAPPNTPEVPTEQA